MESKEKISVIRILYIIHTLFYILAVISHEVLGNTKTMSELDAHPLLGFFVFVMLLKKFFIPYITTVFLTIWYFIKLRNEESMPDKVMFIVMLVINILCQVRLEIIFQMIMAG